MQSDSTESKEVFITRTPAYLGEFDCHPFMPATEWRSVDEEKEWVRMQDNKPIGRVWRNHAAKTELWIAELGLTDCDQKWLGKHQFCIPSSYDARIVLDLLILAYKSKSPMNHELPVDWPNWPKKI